MLAIQNTASRINLPYISIRLTGHLLPVRLPLGQLLLGPKDSLQTLFPQW